MAGVKSLKDYLKKYESSEVVEKKKKKKKPSKPEPKGVLVVDEDPVWQKQVDPVEEENEDDSAEERPMVDEDIEVKRMRRLEQIKAKRAQNAIAEDGSGWVSLPASREDARSDLSPPRRHRARNDSPSPEPGTRRSVSDKVDTDMSPPRRRRHVDTPEPEPSRKHAEPATLDSDLSPPRKRKARNDSPSPSPKPNRKHAEPASLDSDFSPPRKRKARNDSPSPEPEDEAPKRLSEDLSPRRRRHTRDSDLSPPRKSADSRRSSGKVSRNSNFDISPPRKPRRESPPQRKTGLISGKDIGSEYRKKKADEQLRFKNMDSEMTGQNAEAVFRDRITGKRISKEDYLKSKEKKVVDKPKEIKLEWGKGLAQKREAEATLEELELEKDKPFARTRDDPELDQMLKERTRWGDPMAHLVKKKQPEISLADLGDDDKMKASGFVIPQDIPKHSWIKRGLEAAPNRYGIKPGRHWDGVDRSNGTEKKMFLKTNERKATEREAYLWSVSEM